MQTMSRINIGRASAHTFQGMHVPIYLYACLARGVVSRAIFIARASQEMSCTHTIQHT